jgi:hypothetical protein
VKHRGKYEAESFDHDVRARNLIHLMAAEGDREERQSLAEEISSPLKLEPKPARPRPRERSNGDVAFLRLRSGPRSPMSENNPLLHNEIA